MFTTTMNNGRHFAKASMRGGNHVAMQQNKWCGIVLRRQPKSSSSTSIRLRNTTSTTNNDTTPLDDMKHLLSKSIAWYSKKLDTHPIITKCITSGIIGGAGDLICQSIVDKGEKIREALENGIDVENKSYLWWWDGYRTSRFVFLGTLLVGPACHYWYGALAVWYPLQHKIYKPLIQVSKRVGMDQFVFTPIILSVWITSLWNLENIICPTTNKEQTIDNNVNNNNNETIIMKKQEENTGGSNQLIRLKEILPDVVVANWMLWIPIQYFNFYYTPIKFQVLVSNCVALVWNSYLSFSTRNNSTNNEKEEFRE